jgi:hypothetical protein
MRICSSSSTLLMKKFLWHLSSMFFVCIAGFSHSVHIGVFTEATLCLRIQLGPERLRQLQSCVGAERHNITSLQVSTQSIDFSFTCRLSWNMIAKYVRERGCPILPKICDFQTPFDDAFTVDKISDITKEWDIEYLPRTDIHPYL